LLLSYLLSLDFTQQVMESIVLVSQHLNIRIADKLMETVEIFSIR